MFVRRGRQEEMEEEPQRFKKGKWQRKSRGKPQRGLAKITCHECGEKGHIARNCKKPKGLQYQ